METRLLGCINLGCTEETKETRRALIGAMVAGFTRVGLEINMFSLLSASGMALIRLIGPLVAGVKRVGLEMNMFSLLPAVASGMALILPGMEGGKTFL